jgi:hypothetical protein
VLLAGPGDEKGSTAMASAPSPARDTAAPVGQAGGGSRDAVEGAAGRGSRGQGTGRPAPLSWVPDAAGQADEGTQLLRRGPGANGDSAVSGHHLRPRKAGGAARSASARVTD